jgi:hypothetical protein
MSISGPGSRLPLDAALAETASAAAEAAGSAAASAAQAVRGAGPAIPANVSQAVTAYDMQHHGRRNVPDLSYGPVVVGGRRESDGSWTVNVGSMPTTIAGPRPGAKPFDIVAYTWKNGRVEVAKPEATGGAGDAQAIEAALAKGDPKEVVAVAREAVGRSLLLPSLGFVRANPHPDAAELKRFKECLKGLEKDHKLDDFRRAVDAEEQREIDGFGGRRPMDWYGPKEVFSALVQAFGTPTQKAIWNKQSRPPAGGPGAAETKAIEAELARKDEKAATEAAIAAAKGLYLPGLGFPRVAPNPAKPDVDRFQGLLAGLEKGHKLDDLKRAVEAEEKRRLEAFGGRRPMDWYGPMEILSTLVSHFGTDSQKGIWRR